MQSFLRQPQLASLHFILKKNLNWLFLSWTCWLKNLFPSSSHPSPGSPHLLVNTDWWILGAHHQSLVAKTLKQFQALPTFGPEKCPIDQRLRWLGSVSIRFERHVKSAVKHCFSAVKPRPGARIAWLGGKNKFWGARKPYLIEFESVDQTKKVFHAKFDEIWGKNQKKKKVFISKNTWSFTNSGLHLKQWANNFHEFKKGLHLKNYANFHKFWFTSQKTC